MTALEIRLDWMRLATAGDFIRVHRHWGNMPARTIAVMRAPYFANNGEVA